MYTNTENAAGKRRGKVVFVSERERRCINCAYFQQYYVENAGNLYGWVAVSVGRCLLTGKDDKRAICGACRNFQRI